MRRYIGIMLGIVLSTTASFGALVASEDFAASDAANVTLENKSSQSGTGFGSNAWVPDSSSSGVLFQHVGGHVFCVDDTTTYAAERDFDSSYAVPSSGALYFSVAMLTRTDSSSIAKTTRMNLMDQNGYVARMGVNANTDGTFTLYAVYEGQQVTLWNQSINAESDYITMVLKLDYDSNELTLWVNPTGEETGDISASKSFTPGTDPFTGMQISTAGGSKDGISCWDYIALGTTWEDVEPPQAAVLIAADDFSATDTADVLLENKDPQSGVGFGFNTWIPDSNSSNALIQSVDGYVAAIDDTATYIAPRDFDSSYAVPAGGTLYFCAVMSAQTDSSSINKTTRMDLNDQDGYVARLGMAANTDGTTTFYGNYGGKQVTLANQSINTPGEYVTMVMKMDFSSNELTLWVNPTGEEAGGEEAGGISGSQSSFTPGTNPFVGMQVSTAGGGKDGTSRWDFAAFGTSWDDVTTQTLPETELIASDDFTATDTVDVSLEDKDPQSGSGFGSNAWIPDSNSLDSLIQRVDGYVSATDDTTTYVAPRSFASSCAVPVTGTLYFSAVMSAQTDSESINKTTRMDLLNQNGYVARLGMGANSDGTTTFYGYYDGEQVTLANQTAVDTGELVTLVLKMDYDSNKLTFMVNPTGDEEGGLIGSRTFVAGTNDFTGMQISTAGGGKDGTSRWDYVALADNWEDAVPQTAPSGILIAVDDFEATDTVNEVLDDKDPQSGSGFGSNVWVPDSNSADALIQHVDGYVYSEDDTYTYYLTRDFASPVAVPSGGNLYFCAIISAKTDSASLAKTTRMDLMDADDYVARLGMAANTDGTLTFYGNYEGQQYAVLNQSIVAEGSFVVLVLKLDFDRNQLTFWVNPTGDETGELSGSKSFTPGTSSFTGLRLATAGANVDGVSRWDYVAVATTWDEAVGMLSGTPYELWLSHFAGIGDDTDAADDPDGDGVPNICEWGLGGDPTDASDTGYGAVCDVKNVGSNVFEYVYAKRTDADSLGLNYYVEVTSNLTSGVWVSNNYAVGVGALDDDFNAVTNYVPMGDDASKFVRLVIE